MLAREECAPEKRCIWRPRIWHNMALIEAKSQHQGTTDNPHQ
jgi:hypothetical protein